MHLEDETHDPVILNKGEPKNYRTQCWQQNFAGQWLVIRERDGKVMTSSHSLFECIRWVGAWGDDRLWA